MTMEEIEKAVQHIREIAGDDEAAHGREDELHVAFIRHVADTACAELAKKARRVLTTSKIRFSRWCA